VLVTRRGLDARRRRALETALLPLVAGHIAAGELAWRQPMP